MMTVYGFLGYGQVGQHLARGMQRGSGDRVIAYDHGFLAEPSPLADIARGDDVEVVTGPDGLSECDVVLSIVTPASAAAVARDFAPHARAGQTYVDFNSTAPEVKEEIGGILAGSGVTYLEGVMTGGGITLDKHRIPMSLAGPDAPALAERFNALGFVAEAIGDRIGQAAAMKMLRGVVIKGMEALAVEAMMAARARGIEELVLSSLSESLDRLATRDFLEMLVTTHTKHCGRRSVEVRMIKETVAGSGVEPMMAAAAQRLFERSAAGLGPTEGETVFADAIDALIPTARNEGGTDR
jgi:3-hydroxyisobutyrate dehydrogenase-like beta-hydroxyacid dehydrogenase